MILQSLAGAWQFRQAGTEEWLPAQVPGGVHTDLLALGLIPDPFVGDNELAVQWVAESDWEYWLRFEVGAELLDEERVFLVCDGLDTLAEVTLNGQPVGRTDNMFRQCRWGVGALLVEGQNELLIHFASPVAYISERQAARPLQGPGQCIQGGSHLRKAPSQFGWDWGPQLPPIGIWRDIRLEATSTARLEEVHLRQHHLGGEVAVSATVTLERWQEVDLRVTLRLTAPDGRVQQAELGLASGAMEGVVSLTVADPQLWWPNDYGTQPLYQVEVVLIDGEALRDQRTFQVGLRTLELRQEPDSHGTSFTFVVNGVPIFAKGANWIPADSFPTRISDAQIEHLIASSAQAHMNMLRVWGGGFYEEERFYDACDRHGILVWQDFIFSCSTYPDAPAFFESVRIEATQNVQRLRHRASLALWCGNNEMEWGWVEWGWDRPENLSLKRAYDRVFHHLLPEICAQEDPDRPYWPSSPSSDVPFHDPNSVLAGDTHNWLVWHHNLPFAAYREHPSRFVSEFGFQSLPCFETIRAYADEADWNMTSYVMEHHQRNAAGNSKMVTYMTDHFRLPKAFRPLVGLTQLLQAEAMRVGVEHWRRNRDCTSGALYWQLNDCWPVASWASIDYFGRWKALQYAARRFFAPVLLSAEDCDTLVTLHVTNDTNARWSGTARWSLETLDGEVLRSGEQPVEAGPASSVSLDPLALADEVGEDTRREVVLVYELWQGDNRLSLGIVPFVASKHLKLAEPELSTVLRETQGEMVLEITARRLARFVWLALEGADVIFSDNVFDLPAGRTHAVRFTAPEGWSAEQVQDALRVHSLIDSF
ncbi:MAG: glycoside hydrolase family 2 protein [Anaerolineales bacterium]|nr:glycoside hydrolase family 2 protein [Anaerolineales bacterium]